MFDFFENYTPLVIVIIGILIILLVILSMWKKVPQDKAAVITGLKKRIITGGGDSEHSGVGKVAGNVASVMTSVFETVEQMTGFDFKDVLKAQTYDAKVNKNIQISADSAAKEALNNATEADE